MHRNRRLAHLNVDTMIGTKKPHVPDDSQYQPNGNTGLPNDQVYVKSQIERPVLEPSHPRLNNGPHTSLIPDTAVVPKAPFSMADESSQLEIQATSPSYSVAVDILQAITSGISHTSMVPSAIVAATVVPTTLMSATMTTATLSSTALAKAPSVIMESDHTPKPKSTDVYALLSVLLVTSFIAIFIFSWLHRKNRMRQVILQLHRGEPDYKSYQQKPQTDLLVKFGSSIVSRSTASIGNIVNVVRMSSERSLASTTGTIAKPTTERAHPVNFMSEKTNHLTRRVKIVVSKFRNRAPIGEISTCQESLTNANDDIRSIESNYSATWSASTNSLPRDLSQSFNDRVSAHTNHSLDRDVRPPSLAVLSSRNHPLDSARIKEISSGRVEKIETSILTEPKYCTVSRGSTVSTRSEVTQSERQPVLPMLGIFRKNMYRVEMDFQPRNDTHIKLNEGEHVVITQIFDDGWVFCEHTNNKRKGLSPRACLSSWPAKRMITPPAYERQLGSPDTYTPPGTPLSTGFPRFYGMVSSTESLS